MDDRRYRKLSALSIYLTIIWVCGTLSKVYKVIIREGDN